MCSVVFGKGIRLKGTSDEPPEPPQFTDLSDTDRFTSTIFTNMSGVAIYLVNKSTICHTISAVTCQNMSRY